MDPEFIEDADLVDDMGMDPDELLAFNTLRAWYAIHEP
jgi:hypothetical protein